MTEFGWDASTKPAPATGTFSKWAGSTETEQAQYLVRSFLLFSKLDVTRAYIFFFDDKDEPQVHGSSGLTRNGRPKPAFHAVAHLSRRWATTGSGASSKRSRGTSSSTNTSTATTPTGGSGRCGRRPGRAGKGGSSWEPNG